MKWTQRRPRERRTAQALDRIPVTMAKGIHLFPYRTQKLSLSAPMVLAWRRAGRVGRCRIPNESPRRMSGVFHLESGIFFLLGSAPDECTLYLARFPIARRPVGPEPAAASGGNRQAERQESQGAARGAATMRVPRVDTAWGKTPGRVGRCRIS